MSKELAIRVSGIEKSYGDLKVLDALSLDVQRGSVFALLGANGAGKTTLINILTTLSQADGGEAVVAGYSIKDSPEMVREAITVSGQNVTVDPVLTGLENLVLVAKLRHVANPKQTALDLLERFDLEEAGSKPAGTYSGGMQRRLDIALSLIGEPRVVFLDEPSTGLDPAARREVWQTIEKLAQSGITIFLTTQYMEEAEHLANTIAVLHGGKIVAQGSKDDIVAATSSLPQNDEEAVITLEDAFLALTSQEHTSQRFRQVQTALQNSQAAEQIPLMNPDCTRKRHLIKDIGTLTARMLRHNIRSADTIMTVLGMPLLILLLFVFVLGGAMNTGTEHYIDYIVPAVLLICVASGVSYTAFRVNADVQSGMFDRFRTMPIARISFIAGHVVSSVVVNGISCIVLLVIAVLIGYRPQADVVQWLLAVGLLCFTLIAFASIGVAFGVLAKSSEGSGMFSYLLIGLLFVSSGFAPTDTMPGPLQVFADCQPMTPLINAIRTTLLGQTPGNELRVALLWLCVITVIFFAISFTRINKHKA